MSDEPRPRLSPALLELARRSGDGALPPAAARRARARLEDALAGRPARRHAALRIGAGAAAVAAAAAAALALAARPLRYEVSGAARLATGEWVQTSDEGPGRLAFSDGTRVDVAAGTSLRIARVDLRGADLVQERGRAFYAVTHRRTSAWRVAAGPYHVTVTGTRFAVTWAPERGEFVAELHEGSVVVDGPDAAQGIVLRAGQRFRALASGAITVEPLTIRPAEAPSEPASASASAPEPASAPAPAPTAASAPEPASAPAPAFASAVTSPSAAPALASATLPPARRATPRDASAVVATPPAAPAPPPAPASPAAAPLALTPRPLAERLVRGEAAAIVAEVEREGLDAVAARSSPAELVTIADAARYAHEPALALAALRRLRERHPRSREATLAAFHLGRAADDERRFEAAIAWYETYLRESAGAGPFAPEVRGRKMLATARTGGTDAARALAAEYLRLHPDGPYALQASALAGGP